MICTCCTDPDCCPICPDCPVYDEDDWFDYEEER